MVSLDLLGAQPLATQRLWGVTMETEAVPLEPIKVEQGEDSTLTEPMVTSTVILHHLIPKVVNLRVELPSSMVVKVDMATHVIRQTLMVDLVAEDLGASEHLVVAVATRVEELLVIGLLMQTTVAVGGRSIRAPINQLRCRLLWGTEVFTSNCLTRITVGFG